MNSRSFTIRWGRHCLELGRKTCVMGILNATPDSFSDGGIFCDHDAALAHCVQMVEQGAHIIDIGGESTRPFSDPVSEEEETRRVVPLIETLAKRISVPISIDTTKAGVARRALEAGASIINDISSLRSDPDMAEIAAVFDVPIILMHMKGTPKTMQEAPHYDNLVRDVRTFLLERIAAAIKGGIGRDRIIVDPGIGFGKTFMHNLSLIRALSQLADLQAPILVGASRKAFIRHLVRPGQETAADQPEVETGTQAAVAAAVLNGAHIVRVHNVGNTVATVHVIDAIQAAP